MKRNLATIVVGALILVIAALLLFTFQLRQSEVAVVTTFGKPTSEFTEPRPYPFFKWPWPIQTVYKLDKRIQNFEDKFSETLTADNNNILTRVYVGWKISDAKTFFPKFAGGSIAAAERQLESVISQAKTAIVGKHPLSDFVNANEKELKFDAIEGEIKAQVQSQLKQQNWGIEIDYLGIKQLGLPDSVTAAVFERMTAERTVLVSKLQNEGQAEADKIRSSAEREAAEKVNAAQSKAKEIRASGEAVAAQVLPVFQQNPELAIFLLKTEALESALKERSQLIFDANTPPFDLFKSLPKSGK
ncbi:MAG: protease modulator HflC [Verrucomicrobia bacterium]|nr:protease modulator HflC [Verrucomicrobiota bacterium]